MDKGSDDIRQDIESTRASLDTKLSMLENRAQDAVEKTKEAFDVRTQVEQRPWAMLGLSVLAGYVLGSLGSDSDDYRPQYGNNYRANTHPSQQDTGPSTMDKVREKGGDFLSQFDDEINMLKAAALTTLTGALRDAVKGAVPALSQQIDKMTAGTTATSTSGSGSRLSSNTPSTSPGASLSSGNSTTNRGGADYDSIGQMNRVGMPPRNTANDDATAYYETASVDPDDMDQKAINETRRYSQ